MRTDASNKASGEFRLERKSLPFLGSFCQADQNVNFTAICETRGGTAWVTGQRASRPDLVGVPG